MKYLYFIIYALIFYSCSNNDNILQNPQPAEWKNIYSENFNDTVYVIPFTYSHSLFLDTIDVKNSDSVKCRVSANAKNIFKPQAIYIGSSAGNLMNMGFINNFPPIDSNNIAIFEQSNRSPGIKDLFILNYYDYNTSGDTIGFLVIKKVEIYKK